MDLIKAHFPSLTPEQLSQFDALDALYRDWNTKINVISRKDIDNLYLHHVLHSLAIAVVSPFRPATRVLDVGTGGGFPGIPLAIMFPEASFRLIDGTGKKVMVAREVARAIGLKNVETVHERVEDERGRFHFVVSRAAMPLLDLVRLTKKNIARDQFNVLPNGVIALKGGDLTAELRPLGRMVDVTPISSFFPEPWFVGKSVVTTC